MQLPGSKSLSNRILLLAALSKGLTAIDNVLVRVEDNCASLDISVNLAPECSNVRVSRMSRSAGLLHIDHLPLWLFL